MKYLKRYNENLESEGNNIDIIQTCKDILLELQDEGFTFSLYSHQRLVKYSFGPQEVSLSIKRKEAFDYSDIKDVVERLKLYLAEYKLYIDWMNPTEYRENKPTIKTTRITNPYTFTPEGFITVCEIHFLEK